jgi:hypothetical protein
VYARLADGPWKGRQATATGETPALLLCATDESHLEPALREGIDAGELRLLFALTDFHGLEAAAVPEDVRTGLSAWFGHHSAWKRVALATDVKWVATSMHMFAWMTPGDVMICGLDQLEDAKAWVAR